MVVSTSDENVPHGAVVFYHFDEASEKFYFVTKTETQKIKNINRNSSVALTIFSETPPRTFQARCKAKRASRDELSPELLKRVLNVHSSQDYWPTPIQKIEEGTMCFVEIALDHSRYRDYK